MCNDNNSIFRTVSNSSVYFCVKKILLGRVYYYVRRMLLCSRETYVYPTLRKKNKKQNFTGKLKFRVFKFNTLYSNWYNHAHTDSCKSVSNRYVIMANCWHFITSESSYNVSVTMKIPDRSGPKFLSCSKIPEQPEVSVPLKSILIINPCTKPIPSIRINISIDSCSKIMHGPQNKVSARPNNISYLIAWPQ